MFFTTFRNGPLSYLCFILVKNSNLIEELILLFQYSEYLFCSLEIISRIALDVRRSGLLEQFKSQKRKILFRLLIYELPSMGAFPYIIFSACFTTESLFFDFR